MLQTVLPALWNAAAPSRLRLEGGTHNPLAPSADFIAETFLPTLARMGVQTEFALQTHGFHPAGGGAIVVNVAPCPLLQRIDVTEPRHDHEVSAHVLMSALSTSIGLRELTALSRHFPTLEAHPRHVTSVTPAFGPGNVALLRVAHGGHVEVFDSHGEHRLSAERVGERLARDARHYIDSGAAVSANLADQLLLPMALAGGGRFTTSTITTHLSSNARLIEKFLPVEIEWEASGPGRWMVSILG